jgi:hypothetical protein
MSGLPLRAPALRSSTASEAAPPFVMPSYRAKTGADHSPADTALPPIGVATSDGIVWTTAEDEITLQVQLRFLKKVPQSQGLHTHTNPLQLTVLITFDPSYPEMNHGIVCRNNPVMYVDPTGHSFLDDFATGIVGAAVYCVSAVAIVGTWGAASPVAAALVAGTAGELAAAGAIAGAVSGVMGAALNGGNVFQGAAMGAAFGAVAGGITGSISGAAGRQLAGVIMAAAAGGGAYATGGLEGLAHFGAGFAGALVGGYGMEWLLDPDYQAMANKVRNGASPDQRAMGDTVYGEAGGNYKGNYEDKLGVGWTMRTRKEAGQGSYEDIANSGQYKPRSTLKLYKGMVTKGELLDFQSSYQAAAEVLGASPKSNPIPGVTHFHDLRISNPWGPKAESVTYGSGRLQWYKNVP